MPTYKIMNKTAIGKKVHKTKATKMMDIILKKNFPALYSCLKIIYQYYITGQNAIMHKIV